MKRGNYKPRAELSDAKRRVWKFFCDFLHDYGYPPTYQDAVDQLGFKSKNAVRNHVLSMLRSGHMRMLNADRKYLSRNIVPVNGDACTCPTCGQPLPTKER